MCVGGGGPETHEGKGWAEVMVREHGAGRRGGTDLGLCPPDQAASTQGAEEAFLTQKVNCPC